MQSVGRVEKSGEQEILGESRNIINGCSIHGIFVTGVFFNHGIRRNGTQNMNGRDITGGSDKSFSLVVRQSMI